MRFSAPLFRLKRDAKREARATGAPLHEALDRLARREGFRSWSHLKARAADRRPGDARPGDALLDRLAPGDLVLLGARPGQGKTLVGLDLAAAAARRGRPGVFFTLEDAERDVSSRLETLDLDREALAPHFAVDASDEICGAFVAERLTAAGPGAVAVVDYLQALDFDRRRPALDEQLAELARAARDAGGIVAILSQIDRAFDPAIKAFPDLSDVRRRSPTDLSVFSKGCFLHGGAIDLVAVGAAGL